MSDWTGRFTVARIVDGGAVWETLSEAAERGPIEPVRVTPRQLQILRFIARFRREHAGAPTYAEIGAAVGISARSGVSYQLDQLEAHGLIQRARRRYSTIRLNVTF